MEYTQWVHCSSTRHSVRRLNPCCNGIYSMRNKVKDSKEYFSECLNPCCNGIYSMSGLTLGYLYGMWVLILVVMEYTQWVGFSNSYTATFNCLNPCCNGIYSMRDEAAELLEKRASLNPCCNGIYSMSNKWI